MDENNNKHDAKNKDSITKDIIINVDTVLRVEKIVYYYFIWLSLFYYCWLIFKIFFFRKPSTEQFEYR